MRVFVDYRKKTYEFDVEESMTVGAFKDLIAPTCSLECATVTPRPSHQGASSAEDDIVGQAAFAFCRRQEDAC